MSTISPSGVFLTRAALANTTSLQTAWTGVFQASPAVPSSLIIQDLQALSGALRDLHVQFQFGSQSSPQPHMVIRSFTAGAIDDTEHRIATRPDYIPAQFKNLTPADIAGARLMLFGRETEAFLTAAAMGESRTLASAWHTMFTGEDAVVGQKGGTNRVIEDLALFAITLGQVEYAKADKLWAAVNSVLTGVSGLDARRMEVAALLEIVDQASLNRARTRLFGEAAVASAGAVPPSAELATVERGRIQVRVGGRPVEVSADGIRVYPKIGEPRERVAVRRDDATKELAARNMQSAIEGYLARKIQTEHAALINAHVAAIISGEIGAPVEMREAVIDFVVQSPEHAEAYGLKVLQEAMIAGVLQAPLSVMIGLDDLRIRQRRAQPEVRPPRTQAQITRGGVEHLTDMALEIYTLLAGYGEVMAALARENPGTFSEASRTRLASAAQVVTTLQRMQGGGGARIQYLLDAQDLGVIPEGYIAVRQDRTKVEVSMPKGSPARSAEWANPLNAYISGDQFIADVAERPMDDAQYPFNAVLDRLYALYGYGSSLSHMLSLLGQRNFNEARRGIITFWRNRLEAEIGGLAESGLPQMQHFGGLVDSFVAEGNLRQAEALLDFVQSWTLYAQSRIRRLWEVSDKLLIAGELQAKASYDPMALELLRVGDIQGLVKLMGSIRVQLKHLDAMAKTKQAQLTARVSSALLLFVESARSLGALPDTSARAPIVGRLPAVNEMLKPSGPNTPEQVRAQMRRLGIPVPGEEGVAALGTRTATGYSLPAPDDRKALPAPAEGAPKG